MIFMVYGSIALLVGIFSGMLIGGAVGLASLALLAFVDVRFRGRGLAFLGFFVPLADAAVTGAPSVPSVGLVAAGSAPPAVSPRAAWRGRAP